MSGVFIDSNVILRHLSGDRRAKRIVDWVESGRVIGYVNQVVASEVLYVYIKLMAGKPAYRLKEEPATVKQVDLTPVCKVLSLFEELPSSHEVTTGAIDLIRKYGLLPNDAIIASTCKHYGVGKIATFNSDFKRVKFLEVIQV